MQDACRGGGPELPLGLIRVGLTSSTLRAAPAAAALVEALVLQMLVHRPPGPRMGAGRSGTGESEGAAGNGGGGGLQLDRQASAEEQMLQSAAEAEEVCSTAEHIFRILLLWTTWK